MSDAANSIRKPARRPVRVIPIVEVVLLVLLITVPFFVSDFLTIIVTRMIILGMLAISFDLCWGYSGIMTFGQALFFGMSGYVVALLANKAGFVQLWGVIPLGMLVGLVVSFLIAWFLLLGKHRPEIIFVALGTLTASYAAERLVAGWEWVGAGNGMSIDRPVNFTVSRCSIGVVAGWVSHRVSCKGGFQVDEFPKQNVFVFEPIAPFDSGSDR